MQQRRGHADRGHRRRRRGPHAAGLLQQPARAPGGRRWGLFAGTVGGYRGRQAVHPPRLPHLDRRRRRRLGARAGADLPGEQGRLQLGDPEVGQAAARTPRAASADAARRPDARGGPRAGTGCSRSPPRCSTSTGPTPATTSSGPRTGSSGTRRWSCSSRWPPAGGPPRWSPASPGRARAGGLLDAVDAALPFALTEGQREVGEELAAELAREQPMHRLLQGEVGSGKTVVALRAMAQVVDAGGQAALLAPTEVLAAQHARGIRRAARPARPRRRARRRRRRHPGGAAHRVAEGRRPARGPRRRRRRPRPASSSAPTPCSRRASSSPTSAWSSSTSSTASASSSGTRCAPRAAGRRTCW